MLVLLRRNKMLSNWSYKVESYDKLFTTVWTKCENNSLTLVWRVKADEMSKFSRPPLFQKPHSCGGQERTCRSFLTVWSLGFSAETCLYPNTGISIGQSGYKILSLQIHWNNDNALGNRTGELHYCLHLSKEQTTLY